MSQQPENEALTPQELHETLLSEIEASQQAISELSDEELEEVVGGLIRGMFYGAYIGAREGQAESKGALPHQRVAKMVEKSADLANYGFYEGVKGVKELRAFSNSQKAL